MGKFYYCKYCGHTLFKDNDICPNCKTFIIPGESLHESEYYRNKSKQRYGITKRARDILMEEEIKKNSLYHYKANMGNAIKEHEERNKTLFTRNLHKEENVPRCPICHSIKIEKISSLKRVEHGYAFGLFSNTARSQFECKSCGYKF